MNDPIDYTKIRNLRIDLDFGQKQLAANLGISPQAYSRLERGVRKIRMQHLEIIAKTLGKDITYFLKNSKTNALKNPESSKLKVELLESMMYFICVGIEQELDYLNNSYITKYEPIKFSYADFVRGDDIWCNPQLALAKFKKYIKEYDELKDRPYEWHKEQMEKLYPNINDREKNPSWINSMIDYQSNFEFNGYHPFCHFFGKMEYEYFFGKSDDFIMDFILEESNFDFVEIITNDGVGSAYSYSEEDYYSAFKDMLKDNHVIKLLFQYGFLGQNKYNYYWSKYCNEDKDTGSIHTRTDEHELIKAIGDKMQEIFKQKSNSL